MKYIINCLYPYLSYNYAADNIYIYIRFTTFKYSYFNIYSYSCLVCSSTERVHTCIIENQELVDEEMSDVYQALRHEAVGSFSCDQCGRSFRKKTYLKRHLAIHQGHLFYIS